MIFPSSENSVRLSYRISIYALLIWFASPSFYVFGQHTYEENLKLPYCAKQGQLIKHYAFTLCYSELHEQAAWVAYELTRTETQKIAERTNKFLIDPLVKTGSATNADYKASGYDRGHLAPAADMGWSALAMKESFYYSNMSPQLPTFNRGIWKQLEELVRDWAIAEDTLLVVTGPILREGLPSIGVNKVSIPEYFYKAVLDVSGKSHKAIGFILPNRAGFEPLQNYTVSIDSLESVSGLELYPQLSDLDERNLEKTICIPCWDWNTEKIKNTTPKQVTNTGINTRPSTQGTGKSVQCSARTKSGTRCRRITGNLSGKCYQHE